MKCVFCVVLAIQKLVSKRKLNFQFSSPKLILVLTSSMCTTVLVPVFATAALCLCSDMFKTKIASKVINPVMQLKTLFILQQGQPVLKNCY